MEGLACSLSLFFWNLVLYWTHNEKRNLTMAIFFLTLGMLTLIMVIMAVGVIFSNKELKGSCGGPGQCACEKAGRPKACEQMVNAIDALTTQSQSS